MDKFERKQPIIETGTPERLLMLDHLTRAREALEVKRRESVTESAHRLGLTLPPKL